MKKLLFVARVFLFGWIIFGLAGISMAVPILESDFNDGTLQGWTKRDPFNGSLFTDSTGGNPNGFMVATDTVAGGGALLAQAPGISGDLSYLDSIQWDEFVYNNGSDTVVSTSAIIIGVDGSSYRSNNILGPVAIWTTKSVSFLDPSEWSLRSGSASFDEVIANAEGLFLSMDTSVLAGGNRESGIDNININGTPVPEPSTILLMGAGILGISVSGKKRYRK